MATYGTTIIYSCTFSRIDDNKEIISGSSIDIYEVSFVECNQISKKYSINSTDRLYVTYAIFLHSGGICVPDNKQATLIRIQSVFMKDTRTESCIDLSEADMEIFNMNLTKNHCRRPYAPRIGPKYLLSRFVTIISNECQICANIESELNYINKASHFQFVRNNCSICLIESSRESCNCD